MIDSRPRPVAHAPSPTALYRHSILGQVGALVLAGVARGRAVCVVANREHVRPDGKLGQVTVRTIQRWQKSFDEGDRDIAALEPAPRERTATSVALPEALIDFIRGQKRIDPRASIPEIIRRARALEVIAADDDVDRTTVWRACRRMDLPTRPQPDVEERDSRRWRYPIRMQCVLADGKYFRAGAERLRRVALFFLDDATRYGLGAVVGTSESTELFLRGLYAIVRDYGLMILLYLDHGPGFISDDTRIVVVQGLGAALLHGKAKYPQGHGAIERFNRTVKAQVLRGLSGAADVDPDCEALTLRLQHYLDRYNDQPHEGLDGDTPRERWEVDRPLRFPADLADLDRRFVVREPRTVSSDHVIQHGGVDWEAPRGLANQSVEVIRNVLDGRLFVPHRGQVVQLHPVDLAANAGAHRGYPGDHRPLDGEGIPTTAAGLAFARDMAPITGPGGGFSDKETP